MAARPVRLNITINPCEIKENVFCDDVLQILKEVEPTWFTHEGQTLSKLKSKIFTKGIMNTLYGYYFDGRFEEGVVLVRVYGTGTDCMINREQENRNIQTLYAAGRSSPLYAIFNNGISYGYVYGDCLDYETIKNEKVTQLIAKEMVAYHSVRPEGLEVKSNLMEKVSTFLELSPDGFEDVEMEAKYRKTIKPKAVLREEFEELRVHFETLHSPIVFCHNDLVGENIIYNEGKERVYFIDHELASFNHEHFELANHFCEYAGRDSDFSRYPGKDYQMNWLRYYLQQKALQRGEDIDTVTVIDVEKCYVMSMKYSLVAHLICGLFGLIQAKNSSIEFGFLEYAEKRFGEYFARKDEVLKLKVPE